MEMAEQQKQQKGATGAAGTSAAGQAPPLALGMLPESLLGDIFSYVAVHELVSAGATCQPLREFALFAIRGKGGGRRGEGSGLRILSK
jgi:hypothetical protein